MLLSLEIRKLPGNLTLKKALYNHCLELTQSQRLLKLYILSDLGVSYQSPSKTLREALAKYDARLEKLQAFFAKELPDAESKASFDEGVHI